MPSRVSEEDDVDDHAFSTLVSSGKLKAESPSRRALRWAGIAVAILILGVAAPALAIATCLHLPVIPPRSDLIVAFALVGLVFLAALIRVACFIRALWLRNKFTGGGCASSESYRFQHIPCYNAVRSTGSCEIIKDHHHLMTEVDEGRS